MSQKQILRNGADESMSSQPGFLANPLAPQENEKERTMTATSGQRLCECLGKSNPLGLLVRTLLASSRWWNSAKLLRWKAKPLYSVRVTDYSTTEPQSCTQSKGYAASSTRRDIPSNRLLYLLAPLARPTDATECGLSRDGRTAQEILGGYCKVELLPTPMALEVTHEGAAFTESGRKIAKDGTTYAPSLSDKVSQLLPIPQALDFKRTERKEESLFINLTDIAYKEKSLTPIGGPSQLNPLFWEEMMGYPLEWTLSPFLTGSSEPRR